MSAQTVYVILSAAVCYMLACRVDKMLKGVTQWQVFVQHAALAVCIFSGALMMATEWSAWSPAVVLLGVLIFFLFSLRRWADEAPNGTAKEPLDEIPSEHLRSIVGGTKHADGSPSS